MNKLDGLVCTCCPNGVEHITIGQLIKQKKIVTITPSIKVKRNDYLVNGSTPIISQEVEYISGYCNLDDENIPKDNYVCFGDHSEHIKYVDFAFVQGADGLKILRTDETAISARYLFHAASNCYCRRNNYERHFKYFTDTMIPLPPLPVQREIVRILDNFTELTAELTAELAARRKQYEHYRDELLTFGDDVPIFSLSKISTNCDCHRKPVTKGNREAGIYPYYGASGIVDYVSDYIFEGDYLLISEDGANLLARSTPIAFSISGKNWVNNHAHVLRFDTPVLQKYVEIYLNSLDLSKYISGGAQPKLNQDNLNKIPIPIPSNGVKHIVDVLTHFDALCNDLTSGLSAEITARQKQYEYYRDKLLTFKKLEV